MENKEITQQPTSFETAQREAKALSSSDLVPQQYKGNVANTLVALEIAHRIGASPLMVMQNLHIIHGRPSWSSTFVIAAINGSGKFTALDRKSTRLNSSHIPLSRMPSSA